MLRMPFGFVHMLEKPQCLLVILEVHSFYKNRYIMGLCKEESKENKCNENACTTYKSTCNN